MSLSSFPHLAQRLFNAPLAIHPAKAEIVVAALAERLGIVRLNHGDVKVDLGKIRAAFDTDEEQETSKGRRPYAIISGIARIPIVGTLVQKSGYMRPFSGMTGYDGIRANFSLAMGDPEVRAIAFDIDSPGGECAGCFDLVDTIYRARGSKPIWAILSESAFSAAYALASAADRIIIPRTGGSGSIGVIWLHLDLTKALTAGGITPTLIKFGEYKGETSDVVTLTPGAKKRLQADIDTFGELFVRTVARNRSLNSDQVRNQEAGTFLGAKGLSAGLVDAVMAPDQAFGALLRKLG